MSFFGFAWGWEGNFNGLNYLDIHFLYGLFENVINSLYSTEPKSRKINRKGYGMKRVWSIAMYYPGIRLQELRKHKTKSSQDCKWSGRESSRQIQNTNQKLPRPSKLFLSRYSPGLFKQMIAPLKNFYQPATQIHRYVFISSRYPTVLGTNSHTDLPEKNSR